MRVDVVDPSAYTPPYDAALCAALAELGAQVRLITSRFAYGQAPAPTGYAVREAFYAHAVGPAGSRLRTASKLVEHVPSMLAYRRRARDADIVHFQWLTVQWLDRHLLPRRPVVLTAHDLLPREPRPGQTRAQRGLYDAVDAVVAHSEFGRRRLLERLRLPEDKVRVIHHGAFDHLTHVQESLPPELRPGDRPVALFFGLLRHYKGLSVLLDAWRRSGADAELWIVGRPRIALAPLRAVAGPAVSFVPRFVSDAELAACFRRADLLVLPYTETERLDFSGVLATALAFAKPSIVSAVGGFPEVAAAGAARLVAPGDPGELAEAIGELLASPERRQALAAGAAAAAAGRYSWKESARQTLDLYRDLS